MNCILTAVSLLLEGVQTYKLLTKAHYFTKVANLMHNNADMLPRSWVDAVRFKLYSLFSDYPSHMVWNFAYLRDHNDLCAKRQNGFSQHKKHPQNHTREITQEDVGCYSSCLAGNVLRHLQSSKHQSSGLSLEVFYHEFSLAVQKIYHVIYFAKLKRVAKAPQLNDLVKQVASSVKFPAGCLFPSLDQMMVRLPEGNPEYYNPLPDHPIYIRSQAPLDAKCFESKDAPCLLTFELEGSKPRSIIFKMLTNNLPETMTSSYLENTFYRNELGEVPPMDPNFDQMYPDMHGRLPMYRVTPMLIDLVAVEVMDNCKSLKEFKEFPGFNYRKAESLGGVQEFLRQNWNKYFSMLNFREYANRMVNS